MFTVRDSPPVKWNAAEPSGDSIGMLSGEGRETKGSLVTQTPFLLVFRTTRSGFLKHMAFYLQRAEAVRGTSAVCSEACPGRLRG